MKTFKAWLPFVGVSLLYHAIIIVLVMQQLTTSKAEILPAQDITVELMGKVSAIARKPRLQKVKPIVIVKPTTEPIAKEDVALVNTVPEESQMPTEIQEQNSAIATESGKTNLDVKEYNDVQQKPEPLQKFEPDYPILERRAGTQAKGGLAILTIDKQGNVVDVNIIRSLGKPFDDAFKEAMYKTRYTPGYLNNVAVAVRAFKPFKFVLK